MTHSKKLPQIGRQLLCILVAAAAASGFAQAQQPSLRIATEGTYPPWSFKSAEGQLQGWDVDIANALCEKMKARCEIVSQDWDGIIPGLVARKFDIIVASMAITEQRRQRVDFSDKYKETISRFVAKKGTPADVAPAALKGKTIGVQRGSIQASYLTQNYKDSILKFYDTPQAAELDLVAGYAQLGLATLRISNDGVDETNPISVREMALRGSRPTRSPAGRPPLLVNQPLAIGSRPVLPRRRIKLITRHVVASAATTPPSRNDIL